MKNQRFVRLVALSIPFVTALPLVHADPPSHAPAWGARRNGNGRNNGRPVRPNRNGRNDGRPIRPVVRDNVVRGIVSRVYDSREFDVRVDGRIVRVKADAYQNLRPGDYVVVRGDLRGDTFYAERVNRQDDNVRGNQGRETRVDFRGEVVEIEGPQQLRVRATDGRVYSVRTFGDIERRISRGDVIRVRGTFDGSFVRADNDDVDLLRNDNTFNGGYGDYGNGRVNFAGRVTRTLRQGEIEVRGDNGRTYIIRASNALVGYIRVGDRVQVQGTARGGFIAATDIDRIR